MPHITVLGAGRVGRAVAAALLRDGHRVTAVVRDPERHEPGLAVVRGDARSPESLELDTADAVVLAVTPFTAPPPSFDGFDRDYYAAIVTGIDARWRGRLVAVGLTATLRLDSGEVVMDVPELFPPRLRPFAEAHAREPAALRKTALDWAILTPPAGFGAPPGGERGYELVGEPVTRERATASLPHALYARAVADEVTHPTVHRARVAVVPAASSTRPGHLG